MSKISLKHSGGNVVSLNSPSSAPASADVAFKLPNQDGSANEVLKTDGSGNLSFTALPASGITVAERWHLIGNFNVSSASTLMVVYSTQGSWSKSGESPSHSFHGSIPSTTSMSESNGLFTFPSTGIWQVIFDCITGTSNDQLNMWSYIAVGSDTSATTYASVKASSGDAGTMNTATHTSLIDVTNTSTQKVHFKAYHYAVGGYISGNTAGERTSATFIRLGDT